MKNLILVPAFICLTFTLSAQFSVGVSAGANLSFWKWPLPQAGIDRLYEPGPGFRTAVFGEWQMSPLVALRAELGTQVKGNKADVVITNSAGDELDEAVQREYWQYWEGSMLIQLSPLKKMRNLYVLAGCTAGRLTNGWRTISGAVYEGGSRKRTIDTNAPLYNRYAVAADVGLGGHIPLNARNRLKIEGRFQYGLSRFIESDNVDTRVSPLIVSLGYLHSL